MDPKPKTFDGYRFWMQLSTHSYQKIPSVWGSFRPIMRALETPRSDTKVFKGHLWTQNPRFIMDIGFGAKEPPKKAS